MDAATEPILAVIAHPVAGNPTQFAIERALRAMQLEWRVLSFDIRPEHVPAALNGFDVLGVTGVWIDFTLEQESADWFRAKAAVESSSIDCLYRDEQHQFCGCHQQQEWIAEQIKAWCTDQEQPLQSIWLGATLERYPIDTDRFPAQSADLPPTPEVIQSANVIALTDGNEGPVEMDVDEWPECQQPTLVVDVSRGDPIAGHPQIESIEDLGYQVVTAMDRRVGTLLRCLKRWTGIDASGDIIRDAIEEYLGV